MSTRICSKCNIKKSLTVDNFYKNKSEVGGFQYTCKSCHKQHYKRDTWYNKNTLETNKKYKNAKYSSNPEYRLLIQLRNRVNQYLKKGNKDKTIDFLGCSIKEWMLYLEKQFDKNMTWENHGKYWEIDHIYPLVKGGSFHYTNTQPLTVKENRIKKDKTVF
jgi:hypothetical protein